MSRPIRFLHVTTFYPPYHFGGDALYVYRLSHALAERGHHVDVVHCVDSYRTFVRKEPPPPLPDHPGVVVHSLRSPFGRLSPLLTHQTGRPFLKYGTLRRLFDQPIDVVHFHNISLLGPQVLAMHGRSDTALRVYTTHEHWLVCPMHVLWKFNRAPCDRPTCVRCTLAAGRPPQLWRFTNLLANATQHVDLFLAPSRFTAGMHAERGFTRDMTYLPLFAVRDDDDWRRPGPRPHDRPYFLFVGRLEPVKGLETLFEAWDHVQDADLVVVGEGSQRPLVEAAVARNPRIFMRGSVPHGQLAPYFVHALACIVPSATYEVAPTVVLEAFARRTPVIARDLGGTPELVRESGGGVLFTTVAELVAAVGRFVREPHLRDELGARGYDMFVNRWTADEHLGGYLDLIAGAARVKLGRVPWLADGGAPEPSVSETEP